MSFLFDDGSNPLLSIGYIPEMDPNSAVLGLRLYENLAPGFIETIHEKKYTLITTSGAFLKLPNVVKAINETYVQSPYWTSVFNSGTSKRIVWEPKPIARGIGDPGNRNICGSSCEPNDYP